MTVSKWKEAFPPDIKGASLYCIQMPHGEPQAIILNDRFRSQLDFLPLIVYDLNQLSGIT
jgi:hypothetical protein